MKRTPPNSKSLISLNKSSAPHHGSDSMLYRPTDSRPNESPQIDFVSQRNKRPREDEITIVQFSDFKEEMRQLMTSLLAEQKKDLSNISNNLQKVKESNSNIESCILLLTSQNEEFQKKIALLEQSKRDREHICILEEKIEDL